MFVTIDGMNWQKDLLTTYTPIGTASNYNMIADFCTSEVSSTR
jgi:hypothetical protein